MMRFQIISEEHDGAYMLIMFQASQNQLTAKGLSLVIWVDQNILYVNNTAVIGYRSKKSYQSIIHKATYHQM